MVQGSGRLSYKTRKPLNKPAHGQKKSTPASGYEGFQKSGIPFYGLCVLGSLHLGSPNSGNHHMVANQICCSLLVRFQPEA